MQGCCHVSHVLFVVSPRLAETDVFHKAVCIARWASLCHLYNPLPSPCAKMCSWQPQVHLLWRQACASSPFPPGAFLMLVLERNLSARGFRLRCTGSSPGMLFAVWRCICFCVLSSRAEYTKNLLRLALVSSQLQYVYVCTVCWSSSL